MRSGAAMTSLCAGLAWGLAFALPAEDASAQKVYSTVAPVQARARVAMDLWADPGSTRTVLARVARGSPLQVRGCGVPEGWCEVVHQGRSAWARAEGIEPAGPSGVDTGVPPAATGPVAPVDPPIVIVVEPGRPPRGRP